MSGIVILGAGPAGAAVALGLCRLGLEVRIISEWRRFAALEGVSQRVLEGLRSAGLQQALANATQPSRRQALWNGEQHARNVEFLLDRPSFDQGLREDLRCAGVSVIEGRVLTVTSTAAGHEIVLDGGDTLQADFLVEAPRPAGTAGGRHGAGSAWAGNLEPAQSLARPARLDRQRGGKPGGRVGVDGSPGRWPLLLAIAVLLRA